MAEYGEEGVAVAAARILLSLRSRSLARWPEWIPRPEEEDAVETDAELPPPALPEAWPKRPRLGVRARAEGAAWWLSWQSFSARLGRPALAGSDACSSGGEEERAWSPLVTKVKAEPLTARMPEMPPHHGGPSTSGADGARARSRRRPRAGGETVTGPTAESPHTPLDYADAAGSGASSNGDGVAARSSGDEGRGGSPAKRTRADVAGAEPAAVKVQEREMKDKEDYRDEKGHLLFDLNEDFNMDMAFC